MIMNDGWILEYILKDFDMRLQRTNGKLKKKRCQKIEKNENNLKLQ